eukprot:249298-Chlamydomonas_euryale.AAC.3
MPGWLPTLCSPHQSAALPATFLALMCPRASQKTRACPCSFSLTSAVRVWDDSGEDGALREGWSWDSDSALRGSTSIRCRKCVEGVRFPIHPIRGPGRNAIASKCVWRGGKCVSVGSNTRGNVHRCAWRGGKCGSEDAEHARQRATSVRGGAGSVEVLGPTHVATCTVCEAGREGWK